MIISESSELALQSSVAMAMLIEHKLHTIKTIIYHHDNPVIINATLLDCMECTGATTDNCDIDFYLFSLFLS